MEFEDEHDEGQEEEVEEEEEEEEGITIPAPQPSYDSAHVIHDSSRPNVNSPLSAAATNNNVHTDGHPIPAAGGIRGGGVAAASSGRGRKSGGSGGGSSNNNNKAMVRYKECQKNHAVNIGGHALDGCGEFMPAGEEGTLDALKCAACSCHRNFHRKETEGELSGEPIRGGGVLVGGASEGGVGNSGGGPGPLYPQFSPYYRTPAPAGYLHVAPPGMTTPTSAHHHHHHNRPLALPSASGGTHSRDEMEDMSHPSSSGGGRNHSGGGGSGSRFLKKRFRTKFNQEQKDKMLGLAEKLGWRIQKQDEAAVQQFCEENHVRRQVFKVWMHNNKNTLGKKP